MCRTSLEQILQETLELRFLDLGFGLERIAAHAVRQHKRRRFRHIVERGRGARIERGYCFGALEDRDVGAVATDAGLNDHLGDRRVLSVGHRHLSEPATRLIEGVSKRALELGVPVHEGLGIAREELTATHDLGASVRVLEWLHGHGKSEPVRDLRPQLSLFLVHGSHEKEASRVRHGDALPLDCIDSERRRVEQQINQVIVEKVDLVDVENTPVCVGEQAGLECLDALAQRVSQVERAGNAILCRVQGQINQPSRSRRRSELLTGGFQQRAALAGRAGFATERASVRDDDLGHQLGEPADCGGFRRAAAPSSGGVARRPAGFTALSSRWAACSSRERSH